MRRGAWANDPMLLDHLSTRGVIEASTLRSLGVAPATVVHRTQRGGPWQRILPGLVLLRGGHFTAMERNTAAMMYGGETAILSGHAGLALHGYKNSAVMNETLILVPQLVQRKDAGFLTVERTWRPPEPLVKSGIRVAPVVRCLTDAARRLKDSVACTAMFAEAVQRGDVTVSEVLEELDTGSSRGTAMPRRVLRDLATDAHSVAEVAAQKLYERSGLPPMIQNCNIYTSAGVFLGCADNWLDPVGLDWEIDSFKHHFSPRDHEKTLMRRTAMQSTGIIVAAHLPRTIRLQPDLVIDDLRKAYEQALARPRPNVVMRP